MGNPLAQLLATYYLESLKNKCWNYHLYLIYMLEYIGDILLIVDSKNAELQQKILTAFNVLHSSMKFTLRNATG